ncbi:hypothetical protein BJY04DRAFT_212206 [Aspergillus karnatakaensis]|uniref:uncharacterized protein n=1 Tax=Aspergillus karnatakaensis TaxID=1810916 RepID=UPI003CCD8C38
MSDSIPLGPLPRVSQETHTTTNRDHDEPPPDYQPPKEQTELKLHSRSVFALLLALFYSGLVIAPWVITCRIADRPITPGGRYGPEDDSQHYHIANGTHSSYINDERWYHAARVIQTIASVLTLPVTSSICASAAVIFMQRQQRLTMPQLMTLADRGWMDRATYRRILSLQWPHYGSSLLLIGLFATVLGLVIAPIQSIFLTSQVVKTPIRSQNIEQLWDIPTTLAKAFEYPQLDDSNIITLMTRTALTTATEDSTHPQLWAGANVSCNAFSRDEYTRTFCTQQGATFSNISGYPDPFLAELPSHFHSGILRQFLPRFNSTTQFEPISEADFPENCDQIPDAFFVEYTNSTRYYDTEIIQTWGLKACMPGNVTQSPWKGTRDRHDFSEVLYLDINLTGYSAGYTRLQDRTIYRVTLNTTTGYFELPNYLNGGVAGFLLDKDPIKESCGDHCADQGGYRWSKRSSDLARRDTDLTTANTDLQLAKGKGPLLTIAMALFGTGSYIETRARTPELYSATAFPDFNASPSWPANSSACAYLIPLGKLLPNYPHCVSNSDGGRDGDEIRFEIRSWLEGFLVPAERLENAFNAAAFIATKLFLENTNGNPSYGDGLTVSYDMGADTQVPVISRAGIIFVSILIGLHLATLLGLGVYAAWMPRWTKHLDSFALLRMGASISERVPLFMAYRLGLVKELREVSGWMGDQMPEGEDVGMLGLGGPVRLRGNRRYVSFHKQPDYYH